MVRSQIFKKMCDLYPSITRRDMSRILDTIVNEMIEALRNERNVQLRNFGIFRSITRKSRIGRNPKTGEKNIQIPSKKACRWKSSKALFERLNKNFTDNEIFDNNKN